MTAPTSEVATDRIGQGAVGCSFALVAGCVAIPILGIGGTLVGWWAMGLWDGDLMSVIGIVAAVVIGAATPPFVLFSALLGLSLAALAIARSYRITGAIALLIHLVLAGLSIAAMVAYTVPIFLA